MHPVREKLSQIWTNIQGCLFAFLEEEVGPLTQAHQEVVKVLELVRIEEFVPSDKGQAHRPAKERGCLARGFVAKAVLNLPTTAALLERLKSDATLRRLCGWERRNEIPSESTFSRTFAYFAATEFVSRVHEALVKRQQGSRVVGHISRDATAIEGREKPVKRESVSRERRKRGRPKKGEVAPPPEPTRLERQVGMSLEQMLQDLPKTCDIGCKRNSKNSVEYWVGYKLHLDIADGQIPISAVLTSASVHDSQAALPLAVQTVARVTSLYDLMDSAYDADIIRQFSLNLGHVPLIDRNFKGDVVGRAERQAECRRLELLHFTLPEDERFKERSTAERVNGRLKDEFGGRFVRVRGHAKVLTHLMFGLLALTADQLLRLVT
jgi:hypothetical protein